MSNFSDHFTHHFVSVRSDTVPEMVAAKNFFVCMLIAWVASGPSSLAWHHALEHSGVDSHSVGCCSAASSVSSTADDAGASCDLRRSTADASESCLSATESICHFGFAESDTAVSDCLSAEDRSITAAILSRSDECRICEILMHSDAAVYGSEFEASCDVVYSTCDEGVVSRPFKRWFGTWSVRGPPSC